MATLVNILEDLLNQYWNTSGDNIELILENSNSNIQKPFKKRKFKKRKFVKKKIK